MRRARFIRLVAIIALAFVHLSPDLRGAVGRHAAIDFTGDGKTDFVLVRNTGGGPTGAITWYDFRNAQRLPRAVIDFDGNGRTDYAVVRNTGGGPTGAITWFVTNSYTQFTDDVLVAQSSVIKTSHVTELRTRINALRNREGLASVTFSPVIFTGSTVVGRQHILDLRTALAAVYVAMEMTPPTYTNASLTAGVSVVKLADINELRSAVTAVE